MPIIINTNIKLNITKSTLAEEFAMLGFILVSFMIAVGL
jgi:hypothetical protein